MKRNHKDHKLTMSKLKLIFERQLWQCLLLPVLLMSSLLLYQVT